MRVHAPLRAAVAILLISLFVSLFFLADLFAGPEESDTVLQENLLPARQGDPQAQVFVGYLYETGQYVERNYPKAAQWYSRAAEQGNAIAQSQLGSMYWLGKGVPQNYILAYMWLDLAAKGGNVSAGDLKRMVASKMSPGEIAEAKRMCSEWKPKRR